MTQTPYTGLPHWVQNMSRPDVRLNDDLDKIDGQVNGFSTIDVSAADATIPAAVFQRIGVFKLVGAPGTQRLVNLPQASAVGVRRFLNRTGSSVVVQRLSAVSSAVVTRLPASTNAEIAYDGTDAHPVATRSD